MPNTRVLDTKPGAVAAVSPKLPKSAAKISVSCRNGLPKILPTLCYVFGSKNKTLNWWIWLTSPKHIVTGNYMKSGKFFFQLSSSSFSLVVQGISYHDWQNCKFPKSKDESMQVDCMIAISCPLVLLWGFHLSSPKCRSKHNWISIGLRQLPSCTIMQQSCKRPRHTHSSVKWYSQEHSERKWDNLTFLSQKW